MFKFSKYLNKNIITYFYKSIMDDKELFSQFINFNPNLMSTDVISVVKQFFINSHILNLREKIIICPIDRIFNVTVPKIKQFDDYLSFKIYSSGTFICYPMKNYDINVVIKNGLVFVTISNRISMDSVNDAFLYLRHMNDTQKYN
jgi:hypothetical protein